jgi:MtN3 and saliva related transmembrane protein
MNYVEIIGYLAAAFGTFAFLPQVIKTWKTRSTKDLSLGMYVVFCIGVVFWLTYGILIKSWPLIIGNIVSTIFGSIILFFKMKHG